MTQMASHINEMKRKHEHAVRIQEIQSQLEDYVGEDLTRLGDLVLEVITHVILSCVKFIVAVQLYIVLPCLGSSAGGDNTRDLVLC